MNILFFTVAGFGLVVIVTQSLIFRPFREWLPAGSRARKLVTCPLCFGFWAGAGLQLLYPVVPPSDYAYYLQLTPQFPEAFNALTNCLMAGWYLAIVSWIGWLVAIKLGALEH